MKNKTQPVNITPTHITNYVWGEDGMIDPDNMVDQIIRITLLNKKIQYTKELFKPVAWLMTNPMCDGSADWVEIGECKPEPHQYFEAIPLFTSKQLKLILDNVTNVNP